MSVLDSMGRPTTSRKLTDQQIAAAFTGVQQRLNVLQQQVINMGLFTEYLYQQIASVANEDGTPLVPIDMVEFETWAEERIQEMRGDAKAMLEEAADAKEQVSLDE